MGNNLILAISFSFKLNNNLDEEQCQQYLKSLLNVFSSAEALKDFINPGQEVLAGK